MSGPYEPTPDERRVCEAMFSAVRNKPGDQLWSEIQPVQAAYLRGAKAAIQAIEQGRRYDQ